MKKLIFLFAILLLPLAASAQVEIDDIGYILNSEAKIAEVTWKQYVYTGDVVIPESVEYDDVTYKVTSIGNCAFEASSGLTSVTIPNSVTSIGEMAFDDCSGLTSITIPNSVTSIGGSVFANCTGLTSIMVESGNKNYDSRDNCNAIIETASNTLIAGCQTTTISNSVTSIGEYAFVGCTGLTSITIPNSVTSIGEGAFGGCSSLTSVTIPNSVTSIGKETFCFCKGLTSVTIPNSVISIGEKAFMFCTGLTSVTIPNSVTSIGDEAFWNCTGLTDVVVKICTPINIAASVFANRTNATLYVPEGSRDAYMGASYWNQFDEIKELEQCAKPIITMKDGEMSFSCETEDVTFVYSLITPSSPVGEGQTLTIPTTYTISVYAMKDFYMDSEAATMEFDVRGLKGDVNGNGEVNVVDLTELIEILLK